MVHGDCFINVTLITVTLLGVYFRTDCALSRQQPEIKSRESFDAAGRAAMKEAISSQSSENVDKSICKFVIFESK